MADRCYCILEGGGAKGIAHVGVLRALEKSGLELVGFAGTSAGALVAALAAAGYSSTEMFGATGSILDNIDLSDLNDDPLVTKRPVATPRRLLGGGWWGMQLAARIHWALLASVGAALVVPWIAYASGVDSGTALAIAVLFSLITIALFVCTSLGFASVAPVRDAINQAVALKLKGNRDRSPINFQEFRQLGGCSLKIVAANIDTGKLVLFSAETTPLVAVADAVAASICIPVVFGPWRVGSDRYFDGGLVSNLPAWAFDNERARDRDAWTAAVEISDADYERPTFLGLLKAAALTAVFGSSMLNTRSVERLKGLRLKVDLKLLQFNFDRATAATIIEDAERECERRLIVQLVDVPDTMREVCETVRTASQAIIDGARESEELPPYAGSIRVGLFRTAPDDPGALINAFSVGFERSADERLRLPRWESLPGQVLRDGEARFAEANEWRQGLIDPQDRWALKSLSPDIRWCLCVCHPERLDLVAWIDGDMVLDLAPDTREDILAVLADEVSSILKQGSPQELFSNDD